MPRPSGLPIVDDDDAPVLEELAHVEARGRFNFLPRWRKRFGWMSVDKEVQALMIFVEPGLISFRDWRIDGPRVQQRYRDVAASDDADRFRMLRLIQTRYRRLIIPAKDRSSLGDAALAHLGLPIERGRKSAVYVTLYPGHLDLASPDHRNAKSFNDDALLDDLP
jgi:hypothetical protein